MAELEIKPTFGMRLRVLGVIAAGVAIALTLVYLLVGGGEDLFAPRTTLTTYMPDSTGLDTTSEVRLSGIRIGTVESIKLSGSLDHQRAVEVKLRVLARYLKGIPSDSQTDISADTLVGSQFVDIAEGRSLIPVSQGGVLGSQPVKDAEDRANLIKSVQDRLKQVDAILVDLSNGQGGLGKFFLGETEYDRVLGGVTNFDNAVHTFLTPKSDLGKAFYSLELYDEIRDLLLNVDQTLMSIQNSGLLASDQQYNEALAQLRDLRASLASLSSKDILRDDAAYRRIAQLLAATDQTIASLNAGEGRAGNLLTSPQLYESLNGSLRGMETFLRDLRVNPHKYLRYKIF
jgi:phospholipid/cholesterol/gamma-HCH transport system substrate-binding protein